MNGVMDAIKGRRSVRKYKQQQISDGELSQIVAAGQLAPSGHNRQTTHFVVVQQAAVLEELRRVVREAFAEMEQPADPHDMKSTAIRLSKKGKYNFMYNPPTFIIAANKRGYGNAMADTALALGNMMLLAQEIGIGSCWINQLRWLCDDEKVMRAVEKLGIGRDEVVCGGLALGYSDQPERPATVIQGNRVDYIK
jgi:Nitroreductase